MAATSLDTELLAEVQAAIAELGPLTATFSVVTVNTVDKAAGTVSQTTQDYTVPCSPVMRVTSSFTQQDNTVFPTAQIVLAGADLVGFLPTLMQKVVLNGVGTTWRVVGITPIYSGESVCAWKLGLAK